MRPAATQRSLGPEGAGRVEGAGPQKEYVDWLLLTGSSVGRRRTRQAFLGAGGGGVGVRLH